MTSPNPQPVLRVESFGCRANQYDGRRLEELLEAAGFRPDAKADRPDWVVINSCTVTVEADRQARQRVRHWRRRHPEARIVLTGCHAQVSPEEAAATRGVDYVVGNDGKEGLADRLRRALSEERPVSAQVEVGDIFRERGRLSTGLRAFPRRSRAIVKIQDGCDHRCSFCIIPRARGRSRWADPDTVIDQVRRLAEADHAEVVLTGIHLGDYGLRPGALAALCRRIERETPLARLRLSSLDPHEFDEPLLEFAASSAILCDHFHIPLQSGSDAVLGRMRRSYTADDFTRVTRALRRSMPQATLGVDAIVGFPGETEEEFEATCRLIESASIALVHVFPYSARAGTPAARMGNGPDPVERAERCARLREMARRRRREWLAQQVGRIHEVIWERRRSGGILSATSRNFLPVHLIAPGALPPKRLFVKPMRWDDRGLYAY